MFNRRDSAARISMIGLMAAIACVSNYFQIPFMASRLHIGNAVCALAGLLLGPVPGFLAAGIGNGLYDIIGGYGAEFIVTLFNKGAIALVAGLVAGAATRKEKLGAADSARIALSCAVGTLCYTGLYLIWSYIKERFIKHTPLEALGVVLGGKAVASLMNAAFATIVTPIFYRAIRPALHHAGLL